jgi:hypothetical protein
MINRNSLVNYLLFLIVISFLLSSCKESPGVSTTSAVTVDILYLNHAPVLEVLEQVDPILASYGEQIKVNRYDYNTSEGAALAEQKGIKEHMPLIIYINGTSTFDLDGQKITFESFPQGEGTAMMAAGSWTIAELDAALKKVTGK